MSDRQDKDTVLVSIIWLGLKSGLDGDQIADAARSATIKLNETGNNMQAITHGRKSVARSVVNNSIAKLIESAQVQAL